MTYGIVPLAFRAPRYLIVYDDKITTAETLSEEVVNELGLHYLRVVDLDSFQEVLADLSLADLEEDEEHRVP